MTCARVRAIVCVCQCVLMRVCRACGARGGGEDEGVLGDGDL